MGYYKRFTSTKKTTLTMGFVCSKCGKRQITEVEVKGVGITTDKGCWTKAGRERRIEKAETIAQDDFLKKMNKITDDVSKNDYRSLNLNCKCKFCNNEELWSNMDSCWSFLVMILAFLIGFIMLILYALNIMSIKWLLIPIVAFIVSYFINKCYCFWKSKQVKKMPKEYLPVIISDEETLRFYMESPNI